MELEVGIEKSAVAGGGCGEDEWLGGIEEGAGVEGGGGEDD